MTTLQYLRLRRGWSQGHMGRFLKVQPLTVQRLETGQIDCPEVVEFLEPALKALFGDRWSYADLMAPVPDLTALADLEQSATG